MIEEAIKIAKRSTIRTHKSGCVIVRGGEILSNGWSHVPENRALRSLHAEMHALARGRHLNLTGATAWVATIISKSGNQTVARPCLNCAIALRSAGIHYVKATIQEGHITNLPLMPGVEHLFLDQELDLSNLKVYVRNS